MKQLAELYRLAAELVADGEEKRRHYHMREEVAMTNVGYPDHEVMTAFAAFKAFFEQPKRQYWFGRFEVYEPMKATHPKDYRKRVKEVRANQQARIYGMLFMWAMARAGDV